MSCATAVAARGQRPPPLRINVDTARSAHPGRLYAAQGVAPDKHVIIFTRGGLQLTHTLTVLNLLGFENVDLFTGAFEGWDNASYRNL